MSFITSDFGTCLFLTWLHRFIFEVKWAINLALASSVPCISRLGSSTEKDQGHLSQILIWNPNVFSLFPSVSFCHLRRSSVLRPMSYDAVELRSELVWPGIPSFSDTQSGACTWTESKGQEPLFHRGKLWTQRLIKSRSDEFCLLGSLRESLRSPWGSNKLSLCIFSCQQSIDHIC